MKKSYTFMLCLVFLLLVACDGSPSVADVEQTPTITDTIPVTSASLTPVSTPSPSPTEQQMDTPDESLKVPSDSTLEIHFIDVGQADSALILCDDAAMLIDGGNVEDSDLVYTYLRNENIDSLDYIVCTHAHEDHVGGLSGALNYTTANVAFCPVTDYDSNAFQNFVRYLGDTQITVPTPGDTYELGSASFAILGPISPSDDPNNTSIVLKLTYGETSFLFTGDAERDEEQDILNAGYDLSATVLKVGHHGSDTSTTYPFLREIMPQYAVISCGAGNSYRGRKR